ncbi:hypothetical protein GW915_01100 [bacterium]|nr:hypothetical protein [bacterium]
MYRSLKPLLFVLLAWTLSPLTLAQSDQELEGRIGLGVSNIGPNSTESISVDWQATQATSFEFNIGVDTAENNNYLEAGLRVNRNLFIEENLAYFLYIGGAAISQQVTGINKNGYGIDAGIGGRFFLNGLPNLGFSFRGGLKLVSTDEVSFRTAFNFGIHYYF